MSTEKTPAERIFSEREKTGLTSTEFAKMLGVTQPCIKKWETGRTLPNGHQLIKMYNLFNILPCFILLGINRETMNEKHREKRPIISGVD